MKRCEDHPEGHINMFGSTRTGRICYRCATCDKILEDEAIPDKQNAMRIDERGIPVCPKCEKEPIMPELDDPNLEITAMRHVIEAIRYLPKQAQWRVLQWTWQWYTDSVLPAGNPKGTNVNSEKLAP
ncbi:MAG: hypothetical protein FJY85_25550 [Deltaproteobacteria bacterium]|nr:hypothetical protein [Deltaproteobacteria bacterium]